MTCVRIAHHEPICFVPGQAVIDTTYARQHYNLILQLFQGMSIDESALLYGLDQLIKKNARLPLSMPLLGVICFFGRMYTSLNAGSIS